MSPGRNHVVDLVLRLAGNAFRTLRGPALYALAFVFLGVVLWRTRVWDAGDSLRQVNPLVLALVPLLSILLSLPLALRQRIVLSVLGWRFSAWRLLPIAYYGNTVSFLTPVSSGEILRPALFQRGLNVPLPQGVAIVLYERLYSSFLLGISGLLALVWTGVLPFPVSAALVALLAAAPALPYLGYWAAGNYGQSRLFTWLRNVAPGPLRRRLQRALGESRATLDELFLSRRLIVSFCLTTYLTFFIMTLQFWLLVREVTAGLSLPEAWVVLVASNLAGMLSGLPLGLGATDATMVSLLGAYGSGGAAAATVVVLLRGLINLPTGLLGLLSYVAALRQRPAEAATTVGAALTR